MSSRPGCAERTSRDSVRLHTRTCLSCNAGVQRLPRVHQQSNSTRSIGRLETLLMPANFSSLVGEFMFGEHSEVLLDDCEKRVPQRTPRPGAEGLYPGDSMLHADTGIEIKGSRYLEGLARTQPRRRLADGLRFRFKPPVDTARESLRNLPLPDGAGAKLEKSDWQFSGRSETSRRTITASVRHQATRRWRETGYTATQS